MRGGRKPTTAELEHQGTSVWVHVVSAAGRDYSSVGSEQTEYDIR